MNGVLWKLGRKLVDPVVGENDSEDVVVENWCLLQMQI